MKIVRYWILIVLAIFTGYNSFGQNNLVPFIQPAGGRVNVGSPFRIDVSITYNTDVYSNYRVKMKLPAGVSWTPDCSADPGAILIDNNAITFDGTYYTIPLNIIDKGSKPNNFFVNNLLNNTLAICSGDTLYPIEFTLIADQGNNTNLPPIQVSTVNLVTPQKNNDVGTVTLNLRQGQELNQDGTNTGNFPFYIDVKVDGNNLSTLPSVTLTYPYTKLTFINAVLYNNTVSDPPFHKAILDPSLYTYTPGSFNIHIADGLVTYNNPSNDYIRFYFNTSNGQIGANEIILSATGAKYVKCGGTSTSDVVVKDVTPGINIPIVASVANLYPSFQYYNKPLEFCAQNCNFNVSSVQSKVYFEINDIYTQFSGTVPRVKVQCPVNAAKITSLEFSASQFAPNTAFKYLLAGSTVEQTATVSGNIVSFGTSNPQVIYIDNYAPSGASRVALDFAVNYSSLFADLSSVPVASKVFTVSYVGSVNAKVYTSEPMSISTNCTAGMKFMDQYELSGQNGFGTSVYYLPNDHENIRIAIRPRDASYGGNYTVTGFRYTLNPNMSFDPLNKILLYSETDNSGSYKPIKSVFNGTYYKSVDIHTVSTIPNTIEINFSLNNTGLQNCGIDKPLYIMIPVMVNKNASNSGNNYESTYQDNAGSFNAFEISSWNVQRSDFYKLSAEVKVLCPGDHQEMSDFEKGQTVTVQYILNNENQNAVKGLNFAIPGISNGAIASSASNGGVTIRSKNVTAGQLNSAFTVSPQGNGLSVMSNNSYVLNGSDRLIINVQYLLNQNLSVGTQENNITYLLNSYQSLDGETRTKAEPLVKKNIRIVAESNCIPTPPCKECVTSFSPVPGQEYVLSGWIKEGYSTTGAPAPKKYVNTGIQITFNDGDIADLPLFQPNGPIIDGWQRVDTSFVVPANAYNIKLELVNNGDNEAFFDDVRVHPFRSNMKSFVYDPSTQRLVAELDENNYATLYEYDDEGILIRVKKETQRGVMTVKESRNNQSKIK